MDVSTIVCSYLYGTYMMFVGAIEAYQSIAKGMLERIESLALATLTLWNFTISKVVDTTINFVKVAEKKLVDMFYNPSEKDALGHNVWCHRLWECLTFVEELMDPGSFLFRKLNEYFTEDCSNKNSINAGMYNYIRGLLQDFQQFQKTVCSYGFTVEFGISMIRQLLEDYIKTLLVDEKTIGDAIAQLKDLLRGYLDWTQNVGLTDYLDKLAGLFTCIIDSSESCATIATASNYYASVCSFTKIEKNGDSWSIQPEYRNSIYGSLEGAKNRISNAKQELTDAANMAADPKKVKRANAAFNLSKNVFPGGIKWSDVSTEDGKLSWTKLTSKSTWRKTTIYKKFDTYRHGFWKNYYEGDDIPEPTLDEMMAKMRIDENGDAWYEDDCRRVKLNIPEELLLDTPEVEEVYMDGTGSDEVILFKGKIMSVTQAAVEISKNPDGDLALECERIWRTLHDWQKNDDVAKKY